MNEEEIKNNIRNELRNIKLTAKEKRQIFERVISSPIVSPYTPVRTLWQFTHRKLVYVLASFLIIVLSGGTVAYASLNAIPGENLYAVKVRVAEPALDALAFTPVAKAERKAEKALRRLNEAEKLILKEELTLEQRVELENRFNKNADEFEATLNSNNAITTERKKELRTSFEASLNAHANIIQKVNKRTKENAKELERNQDKEVTALEEVVREKAQLHRNIENTETETESKEKSSDFEFKKSSVEKAIRNTKKNIDALEQKKIEGKEDVILDATIDNSKESLEKAERNLEQAEAKKQNGENDGAEHFLEESYRSTLEANPSFKENISLP